MIHLSEIDIVVVESTASYLSTYLLSELAKACIPIVICDQKHNPVGEYLALYGSYDSARKVEEQVQWLEETKNTLWQKIIESKIKNQAEVLKGQGLSENEALINFSKEIKLGDTSNREGHAAKVYFNALFGHTFSREIDCSTNAMLDYGYAVLLAWVNREIVRRGYLTQLGVMHRNDYNQFNLGCDFMEPFRPVIDSYVLEHFQEEFNKNHRIQILELFEKIYRFNDGDYKLSSILGLFVKTNLGILSRRLSPESYLDFSISEEV